MSARRAIGKGPELVTRRRGITWALDLREGIDLAIWLFGSFEPATRRAYARMVEPGATAIDIGANVGAHTLQLAKLVGPGGRVLAVEPTDWAVAKLRANLDLNPELRGIVRAEQAALVESPEGRAPDSIYASWPLRSGSDLHPTHRGRAMATTGARAVTLDRLVSEAGIERIDLIKLDVDGAECEVIRGARDTLDGHRPPIVLELAPYEFGDEGSNVSELTSLLAAAGYVLRTLGSDRPLPAEPEQLAKLIPEGGGINAVAVQR